MVGLVPGLDTDVVVVGAGVVGAATARALARDGHDVVLLDQFEVGHDRGSSHGTSRVFRLSYPDERYVRLAQASLGGWRELEAESGREILRHHRVGRAGSVRLVQRAGPERLRRAVRARRRARWRSSAGRSTSRRTSSCCTSRTPARFSPTRHFAAFVDGAVAAGASLRERTPGREPEGRRTDGHGRDRRRDDRGRAVSSWPRERGRRGCWPGSATSRRADARDGGALSHARTAGRSRAWSTTQRRSTVARCTRRQPHLRALVPRSRGQGGAASLGPRSRPGRPRRARPGGRGVGGRVGLGPLPDCKRGAGTRRDVPLHEHGRRELRPGTSRPSGRRLGLLRSRVQVRTDPRTHRGRARDRGGCGTARQAPLPARRARTSRQTLDMPPVPRPHGKKSGKTDQPHARDRDRSRRRR